MNRLLAPLQASTYLFAIIALIAGLWWIPITHLEGLGFAGSWSSVVLSAGALPILAALQICYRQSLSRKALLGASAIGAALALYGIAFTMTEIVRVMVLFYIAPFWSLAIEIIFHGRKSTIRDFGGLALLLVGIIAMQQFDLDLASSFNFGDAVAMSSGFLFAIGSAFLFDTNDAPIVPPTLALVLVSIMVSSVFAILEGVPSENLPEMTTNVSLITLVYGSLYLAPVMLGTVHAAGVLSPTVLTTLLSLEIISGFISAALFSGQLFGPYHFIGSFLLFIAIIIVSTNSNDVTNPEE